MQPPGTAHIHPQLLFISPGTAGQTRGEPVEPHLGLPGNSLLHCLEVRWSRSEPDLGDVNSYSLSCWINPLVPSQQPWNQSQAGRREGQHSPKPPTPFPAIPSPGGQAAQPPACTSSPAQATLQVICSRARGGGCPKLSITW